MLSRTFVGGHLGKGRGEANSVHYRLLSTSLGMAKAGNLKLDFMAKA